MDLPRLPAQTGPMYLFRDESEDTISTLSSLQELKELKELTMEDKVPVKITTGPLDLVALEDCPPLAAEEYYGPIEYKLKLVSLAPDRVQHLTTQMNFRLTEGQGEAVYQLGVEDDGTPTGLSDTELEETIRNVHRMAVDLKCDAYILAVKKGTCGKMAQVLVRRTSSTEEVMDVRICVMGFQGAGKSTLIGILLTGKLDNGEGRARMNVFRHRHELERGRTSSIAKEMVGFDETGAIKNHDELLSSWADITQASSKVFLFLDLAGSEKYLKTTLFGVASQSPDYCLVCINGSRPLSEMDKDFLEIISSLYIPLVCVVTKTDVCEEAQLLQLYAELEQYMSDLVVSKPIAVITSKKGLVDHHENMMFDAEMPVFPVSCVDGSGLAVFIAFLQLLQKPHDWTTHAAEPAHFSIDEIFSVHRVGTVVTGVLHQGTITEGDSLLLGPHDDDGFYTTVVRSIHVLRTPVQRVMSGQTAALALHYVQKKALRKGMVLVGPSLNPRPCRMFEAEISLLRNSKPIQAQYEPILHIGTVNQAARVLSIDSETLLQRQSGQATFEFCHHAEYISVGSSLIFRDESHARGVGTVLRLCDS